MVGFVKRHLVAKLALLLLLTIVVGFGLSAWLSVQQQLRSMERLNRRAAESLARGLSASVENAMLSGNGLTVRRLIAEAQTGLDEVMVRVYAPSGERVFEAKGPPPTDLPPHVAQALSGKTGQTASGAQALPVNNDKRCRSCHPEGERRGVLTLGTDGAATKLTDTEGAQRSLALITRGAFEQIMTARKDAKLDDFFEELASRSAVISAVAVSGTDEITYFGDENLDIPAPLYERALEPGPPFVARDKKKTMVVVPLKNEPRCRGCHDAKPKMRGAMFVALSPQAVLDEMALVEVTSTSLEHVMLAGLGRLLVRYLDDVARTGIVGTLSLHDREGRLFYDAARKVEPPPYVVRALESEDPVTVQQEATPARLRYVHKLANKPSCQGCHGTDRTIRGAIEVEIDTSRDAKEREELRMISVYLAILTILLVVAALYLGIRQSVVRPLRKISTVAQHVGEGRLDVAAPVGSDDEIGSLARNINDMIVGLRKKLELSKFVSRETVDRVDATEGTVKRTGERRHVTVLFSDIRGFTSYSETREPEEVVQMLNHFLQAQAQVVVEHGGDIDKFVGDELMARFTGPNAEQRATRCALAMVEAVDVTNVRRGDKRAKIDVGIGINSGECVVGAMGAEQRMDFTAIGDAVNLAARLCSAAKRGQVLVSAAVREPIEDGELLFVPLDSINVKGKKKAIKVFEVQRSKTRLDSEATIPIN